MAEPDDRLVLSATNIQVGMMREIDAIVEKMQRDADGAIGKGVRVTRSLLIRQLLREALDQRKLKEKEAE